MLALANTAVAQDVALIVTFVLVLGGIVNVLVVYILGEVFAERRQNQERRERHT